VLKSTLQSQSGKGAQGQGPQTPKGPPEKTEEEKKKDKENAVRALRYSLYALAAMFGGFGMWIFFTWGAPLRDRNGNEIKDEFSDLPFLIQYAKRSKSELLNYRTFLAEPSREKLLPDTVKAPYLQPPYTVLIELTDVLVHPEWTYKTGWRFKKRPGVDYFLNQLAMNHMFEIVIYTQELGFTAYPIVDALDQRKVVSYTLFRDSTKYIDGHSIKDLDKINRNLENVILIDCHPNAFTPERRNNVLLLPKWKGNDDDRVLYDLATLLSTISTNQIYDVRTVLEHYAKFSDPIAEFHERQRKLEEQEQLKQKGPKQEGPSVGIGPATGLGFGNTFWSLFGRK
jgi:import inner membrane translocase subunit TIM50